MDFTNIRFEHADGIGILTIDRQKVLNALNTETLDEIDACITHIEGNADVRALIVTGAGEKAFVAGADISAFPQLTAPEGKRFALHGQRIFSRLESLSIPVIAAVNGFALGGGLELALACHMRLFSQNAVVGLPEVGLAIIPGYGGTQRLPRIVGKGLALELILTGKKIDAVEAHRIGLANAIHPQGEVLDAAKKMAGTILKNGPLAVGYALEAVHSGVEMSFHDGLTLEAALFGNCAATEDKNEGATAFLEKRKPNYEGK